MRNKKIISSTLIGIIATTSFIGVAMAGKYHSDEILSKSIDMNLDKYPSVDDDVAFKVNSGYVTLTGTADNLAEKNLAEEIVKNIDGVKQVNNNVIVEIGDQYSDEHNRRALSSNMNIKSDFEIKKDIQNSIFLSFKLDSDDILVTVDDGVATLTGTTESSYAKDLAEEKALKAGAEVIVNNLVVVRST